MTVYQANEGTGRWDVVGTYERDEQGHTITWTLAGDSVPRIKMTDFPKHTPDCKDPMWGALVIGTDPTDHETEIVATGFACKACGTVTILDISETGATT